MTGRKSQPVSLRSLIVRATLISVSTCLVLGLNDTWHVTAVHPLDLARALELWSVAGVLAALPVGLALAGVFRLLPGPPSPTQATVVLAVLGLQTAFLLQLGAALSIVLIPLCWFVAALLWRSRQLDELRHLLLLSAALLLGLLASAVALTSLGAQSATAGAARLLPLVFLLAAHGLAKRIAARALWWTLAVLMVALAAIQAAGSPFLRATSADARRDPEALPDLVLVVLDTTRADHLGAYGDHRGLSPNFDRIAAEGALFENAFSTADWTVPSHASLFTGLYSASHGASFEHHRWLDDRFPTLAEHLREHGYQTLGLVANRYLRASNLDQGFDRWVPVADHLDSATHKLALIAGLPRRWADKGAGRAVDELRRWLSAEHDRRRPLFLFVNLMEPHWRYLPPLAWRRAHLPADQSLVSASRRAASFFGVDWMAGTTREPQVEEAVRALYGGAVAYQDHQLGRLLATLEPAIDLERTLLIITADHGENLGEGGRWDHVFAVNDALLRVPLAVRYPARFAAGSRIAAPCELTDLLPTVLDVVGIGPPAGLPGRSLADPRPAPREITFAESVPYYGHLERMSRVSGMKRDISRYTRTLRSARDRRFKLVWSSDGSHRLYDLGVDPAEAVSVLSANPEVAGELHRRLLDWWSAIPHYQGSEQPADDSPALDDDQVDALRSLGYLQ